MPLVYLVRHGRVTATPHDARDPELDAAGQAQAEAAAQELQRRLPHPLPILCSPLRRCRETAAPLARAWNREPRIEPRVIEVPSPHDPALSRDAWLDRVLGGSWDEAAQSGERHEAGYAQRFARWRSDVAQAVLDCAGDTVIFAHFIPINALAAAALGASRVVSFRPANGSITVFETGGGTIRLVEQGREVASRVV
ncbi:MAG TPA: histidine phosphatase family protein [Nevskia sp.]|nr:histidine phosphatase family protein [Nevskia sp.]